MAVDWEPFWLKKLSATTVPEFEPPTGESATHLIDHGDDGAQKANAEQKPHDDKPKKILINIRCGIWCVFSYRFPDNSSILETMQLIFGYYYHFNPFPESDHCKQILERQVL